MVQNSVRLALEERWIEFLEVIKKYYDEAKKSPTKDIQIGIIKKLDRELIDFIEEKVLRFKVMDPAMGSGHFLVNALNSITHFILEVLQLEVVVSDSPIKHGKVPIEIDFSLIKYPNKDIDLNPASWRRKVVERCIFGIDINPLTTELAKISLWIASSAKGKPFTFLNHHLKCGDSIMGIRLQDMLRYPKVQKDDTQINLWSQIDKDKIESIKDMFNELIHESSENVQDIINKKDKYQKIKDSPILNNLKDIATLWLLINYEINNDSNELLNLTERDILSLFDKNKYFNLLKKSNQTQIYE
jgi:hypothetical protein